MNKKNNKNSCRGLLVCFVAGFAATAAVGVIAVPQDATARRERPTGGNTPACRLPAGSCIRFLTGTPTQQELDDAFNNGDSVVYTDPVTGEDVYLTPPAFMGTMVQDIGL